MDLYLFQLLGLDPLVRIPFSIELPINRVLCCLGLSCCVSFLVSDTWLLFALPGTI